MNKYISISQEDLKYNAKTLMEYGKTPMIAVVKCNGYGLGLPIALRTWYEAGVRFFAVSEPREALEIRELGCKDADVLLLAPTWDPETIRALYEANVILTVVSKAHAELIAGICPARVHVKVNIGMGRFGLAAERVEDIQGIYSVGSLGFEGIFSHFPQSFAGDDKVTKAQLGRFLNLVQALKQKGIAPGMAHVANSCAALKFPDARLDAVRLGSALIGRLPGKVPCKLRPIGCLKAQIADTNELNPGDTSGYSMVYKAKNFTHTAVVAAGYMDGWGLERHIPAFSFMDVLRKMFRVFREGVSKQSVSWHCKRLPVCGRIGTQYTVVDMLDTDCAPGDWVEIKINIMLADSRLPRELEEHE